MNTISIDWLLGLAWFAMGYGCCCLTYTVSAALCKFIPPSKELQ